ncbi:MAG TPA: hypothetical protein EYQ84_05780 [Nitrospinaceae bacterium]|nr:hypothetical protein [Nitrospinaceae bacterium]HIL27510.1 hypothetical protein [Nitrospinaceae bacterium]
MPESLIPLEEEILELYRSPIIGASYNNTYGEENVKSLVEKFRELDEQKSQIMQGLVVLYSKSPDLATSYVSVAVLHALGMSKNVQEAYLWAKGLDESETFIHHFDIGKSLAEYFT